MMEFKEPVACWGNPDEMYYIDEDGGRHSLEFCVDGACPFCILDDVLIIGNNDDDEGSMSHNDLIYNYLYQKGWPKLDILPVQEATENGYEAVIPEVGYKIQVQYDDEYYYDEEGNVLPEYRMTYGELCRNLGRPTARGRMYTDWRNCYVDFITFWPEEGFSKQDAKKILKAFGNRYLVTFPANSEKVAVSYFKTHEIPRLKDYIDGNTDIPKDGNNEAFNIHLMKGKDKWGKMAAFRRTRDNKLARKLGKMSQAQYNSLIHQESEEKLASIIGEEIRRYVRNKTIVENSLKSLYLF